MNFLSAANKRQLDIKSTIITLCSERLVWLAKLGDDLHTTECERANVLCKKLLRKSGEINVTSDFHKACY